MVLSGQILTGIQPDAVPSAAADNLLSRLDNVRRSGKGWSARCPAHDDHENSLSINEGSDGRVLLKDHAGCSPEAIVGKLGMAMADLFPPNSCHRNHPLLRSIGRRKVMSEIAYEVRDPQGTLVAVHVRREHDDGTKAFVWRLPDGTAGLAGQRTEDLPLFGVELLGKMKGPVVVVEGEKAALSLRHTGICALGTVTGAAGTPGRAALLPLQGRDVVLWPDNDLPGRQHLDRVAALLFELGMKPRMIHWEEAPSKGADAADFLAIHGPGKALDALIVDARPWLPLRPLRTPEDGNGNKDAGEETTERGKKVTQSAILIELAHDAALFQTPDGDMYAAIPVKGHTETWPLRSRVFRRWLNGRFYLLSEKAPGAQAMSDALGVLESRAQFKSPKYPVYTRVAPGESAVYLDLGNDAWEAVELTPAGWRIIKDPPVHFRRTRGMSALPAPVPGGSIEELRPFVNVAEESDWRLLVAWLIGALRPNGPYPLLVLQGEQGSAKTTLARIARKLIDPSTSLVRTIPREERDLMIAAANSWIVAFDNLSGIQDWLSDALCRLATGGGFSIRELYTDDEEKLFDVMRPAVLNGIDTLATRQDLVDRVILLHLTAIPDEKRKDERTFWAEFDRVWPRILGGLMDAVCGALANIDKVCLPRCPRMVDFAYWVTAAETALGWPAGSFMEAYSGNRRDAVELGLESDPVAVVLQALIQEQEHFSGLVSALYEELTERVTKNNKTPRGWPVASNKLTDRLRRLATGLRSVGIDIQIRRNKRGSWADIRPVEKMKG